ncbi:MAG: hypothetical protein R2795_11790 [Saprospiraceae bacterium]
MNDIGKPVPKNREMLDKFVPDMAADQVLELNLVTPPRLFCPQSDDQLKKAAWLFGLMNKHWLVGIGSSLEAAAIRLRLPFVEGIVKHTIFEQFCGGTALLNVTPPLIPCFSMVAVLFSITGQRKGNRKRISTTL